jgi:hypothetical protein
MCVPKGSGGKSGDRGMVMALSDWCEGNSNWSNLVSVLFQVLTASMQWSRL